MSHGHDHGAGHGGVHGHADAHGATSGLHGPAAIPPEPARRSITPAPGDFENLPGASALAWPVLWMALATLLAVSLLSGGWPEVHGEHGAVPEHGSTSR